MSRGDQIGAVLIGIAAVALGIDFLVSPGNRTRRVLLIIAIVFGAAGILILAETNGTIELVGD